MPIRIALIRQRYTPFGGAERFVENALNALQKEAEIELTLITRQWDGADNPNVKKIICNPFHIGRLWRDWSFARCACHVVQKNNFDLVQSHERIPCGDIYRAGDGVHRQWLQQRSRILPWWKCLAIKLSPYHRYLLWQERNMFERTSLKTIIINSSQIGKEIKLHYPKSTAKHRIIYNSVDTSKFTPASKKEHKELIRKKIGAHNNSIVMLFIGSGFERKGVPLLLATMKGMPHLFHLIIVGKDREINKFRRLSKRMGVSEKVHFMGPQQDTIPFYSAADLFVFPTLYDPLPNTVLEAMASGLPVIVSNSCGATDLIHNGIEGLIQDPLDASRWQENISSITTLNTDNEMGKNARSKAMTLSSTRLTLELVNLYKEEIGI